MLEHRRGTPRPIHKLVHPLRMPDGSGRCFAERSGLEGHQPACEDVGDDRTGRSGLHPSVPVTSHRKPSQAVSFRTHATLAVGEKVRVLFCLDRPAIGGPRC
jgi:hypothetical protein